MGIPNIAKYPLPQSNKDNLFYILILWYVAHNIEDFKLLVLEKGLGGFTLSASI